VPVLDSWQLTPEGAVIHPDEKTAVIADVHLGYEWARGAAGDCMVTHSLNETLMRLTSVLDRACVTQLVVAGDLVESPRFCRHTSSDIQQLEQWLTDREVSLVVVEGNHDRGRRTSARAMVPPALRWVETCRVAGWTISHGHKPLSGSRTISGHHHPIFCHSGLAAPCFLVGRGRIVLPAFSANAAGCDVATAVLPVDWRTNSLRCHVSTGREVLDFGPLLQLRRWLRECAS
jgi:putative SbcD/Mre11-related phosphoesterase